MRISIVTGLVLGMLSAGAALAADNFRSACNVDTLCPGVKPAGGAIMGCLREHKTELSQDCKIAIADRILNQQPKKQGAKKTPGADQTAPNPQ